MSLRKEMQQIVKVARAQGWEVTPTRNGHLRFRSPDGAMIFGPSTPSEYRGVKNKIADLRRAGLVI
jgi:predicted RNA binding protein YcfA (HicA-like mRNA interferase family)